MSPKKKNPTFEESLETLRRVVESLEDDEVDLDKAMALYEEGVAARKRCDAVLKAAEARIEKLIGEDGDATEPFETDD